MSSYSESDMQSVFPFVGLAPTRGAQQAVARARARLDARSDPRWTGVTVGLAATMPLVLVGTIAMTALNPTPQAPQRPKLTGSDTGLVALNGALVSPVADEVPASAIETAAIDVPGSYVVRAGDTVISIARHFGLSTASVLALNGLSWSSLVFPNQVLRLTKADGPIATAPIEGTGVASLSVTPIAPAAPTTSKPAATAAAKPAPPKAKAPAAPPKAAASVSFTYTIAGGDTITSIARKFGVTVAAILSTNGLTASSIIYAGRKLTIPGVTGPATTSTAGTGGSTQAGAGAVALTPSMATNARIVVAVGRSLGVPNYGIVIALAAAAQESGLEDLDYGDQDSVGLFQQRPSAGWGTIAQLENPTYAAQLFYGGPHKPNRGKTRGLLDIPGWQSMSVTQAAQAVQDSAYPNAYAKWQSSAEAWLAELG